MPKVHFVKKARKDNRAVKAGEPYYWWSFPFGGGTHYSKTPPKPSQLTRSPFVSGALRIQEEMADAKPESMEDLKDFLDDWIEEIRNLGEEAQNSFDNMPEGLQQGGTGQLLEQRAESMNDWADELEGIDCSFEPENDKPKENEEEEAIQEKLEEICNIEPNIE